MYCGLICQFCWWFPGSKLRTWSKCVRCAWCMPVRDFLCKKFFFCVCVLCLWVLFSNANSKCWSAINLAVSGNWGIFNKCVTLFLTCFSLADLCGADNGCHAVADAYPDCYLCVGNNQWHNSIHVKVRLFWLYYPDLCLGNNQQHHAIHVRVWLSWLYGDHNTNPDLSVCFGNNQWHHSNHVTYYDCSDCLCHGWTVLAFLCDGKYSASFLTHCGQGTMFCYIHPCSAKAILMAIFQRF